MKVSKTAIFLFELMVVILIFSIAAAVCTNVFGKAYGISEQSKDLTMAVLKAESIAEEFKAGNIPDDELLFDGDWKPVKNEADSGGAAVYKIGSEITKDGSVSVLDISVSKRNGGADIYGLQVKSYDK